MCDDTNPSKAAREGFHMTKLGKNYSRYYYAQNENVMYHFSMFLTLFCIKNATEIFVIMERNASSKKKQIKIFYILRCAIL